MHPHFHETLIRQRQDEIERSARRAFLAREPDPLPVPADPVILRLCCVGDDDALERLAQLESAPPPRGAYVVAEVGGAVVAALPLREGPALADPFRRTTHLIPLLELRARQLADQPRSRLRLVLWWAVRGWSRA
jgi:hypothetical protein